MNAWKQVWACDPLRWDLHSNGELHFIDLTMGAMASLCQSTAHWWMECFEQVRSPEKEGGRGGRMCCLLWDLVQPNKVITQGPREHFLVRYLLVFVFLPELLWAAPHSAPHTLISVPQQKLLQPSLASTSGTNKKWLAVITKKQRNTSVLDSKSPRTTFLVECETLHHPLVHLCHLSGAVRDQLGSLWLELALLLETWKE